MNPWKSRVLSARTDHLIDLALDEDIGPGDITTENLPDAGQRGRGEIIAKEPIVVAGLEIAARVFEKFEPGVGFRSGVRDGDHVEPGTVIAEIAGCLRTLLMGERTALNFLQRLSGIATNVSTYIRELGEARHPPVRIVDTRKTVPGWRELDKYAVRVGGADNHRMGLYDGVLIKDNHIAAFGGIKAAVESIRRRVSHLVKIEVETATLAEVAEALAAGADVIMLDNMNSEEIANAVKVINHRALVEVSGRVSRGNLKQLAGTGVDIISIGALIHAAGFVDISMRIAPLP